MSHQQSTICLAICVALTLLSAPATAGSEPEIVSAKLIAAYPDHLERIEVGELIWRDGTRMPLDDGTGEKNFGLWLEKPDIEDMFRQTYPAGTPAAAPAPDFDPGRARNKAFFDKMYGDCRKGEIEAKLKDVAWLPKKSRQRLKVTSVNGVDAKLAAISAELDELPNSFDAYLKTPASTYNCRTIDGTGRTSAHGAGIAIDIAVEHSDYWRWTKSGPDGKPAWRNRIPIEIVQIFERHGFIWGGRWSHFDTMHFEYRPELVGAPIGRAP